MKDTKKSVMHHGKNKINIYAVVYILIVFFASLVAYTTIGQSAWMVIFAVAFTLYNTAILNYYRHTGCAVALFMASDCLYSYFQYGNLPYLNIIFYAGCLIFEVYASMKRGISLGKRLMTPNVNNRIYRKTAFIAAMFIISVVMFLVAEQMKEAVSTEKDAVTLILMILLSCLSLASVITIAFRTSWALPIIFILYAVGTVNTARMSALGSIDYVQYFDTVFVTISLVWAYVRLKLDQKKTYSDIEESRKSMDEEVHG